MHMSLEEQRDEIIAQLKILNAKVEKQNSVRRNFGVGIIYGIGFFVGSAIIATIVFGIVGPFFGRIPWIRDAFTMGVSLMR